MTQADVITPLHIINNLLLIKYLGELIMKCVYNIEEQ